MNEHWIEERLRAAETPPSGERRERTVAMARAIAPTPRPTWRSRVSRPRVLVPLTVLMIAMLSSPGQAATGSAASLVARIVPIHSQTATVIARPVGAAALGSHSARFLPAPHGSAPCASLHGHGRLHAVLGAANRASVAPAPAGKLQAVPAKPSLRSVPARPVGRGRVVPVKPSGPRG